MSAAKKHFLIPDLAKLRRDVRRARGMERINIERLYRLLEPDPRRSPRDVYDLHWALVYLLEGTDEARENAKNAVWTEAVGGGPAARTGHAWDRPDFWRKHLWISSAMAAHIAVAMDWLACEGVFARHELKTMSDHFVGGFWQHIYPHLKGKGRSPFFDDPINQDSAMIAGCLVIGYLFGWKWARDARAKRMYTDALGQAGNVIWQSSPSGFDGDGFTYMRQIQPPVLTLIAMALEAIEGVDFYFTELGPARCSLAHFMEKLQMFCLPSGYSFPHGRYGYVTEWNHYSQAYAARKTGEAHYLERVLEVPQERFITPWIAMDIPLAVVWAPYGAMAGAPKRALAPRYTTWHDPRLWSNIGSEPARVQAHLCWRKLHHGTFILEHDGERCVMLKGERAHSCNGMSFEGVKNTGRAGNDFEHLGIAGMQIDKIQLRDQWDPRVVKDYSKYMVVMDCGTVLAIDRFTASRGVTAHFGFTLANPIKRGWMPSEKGTGRVQVLCSAAELDAQPLVPRRSRPRQECGITRYRTTLPPAEAGFVAMLFNFGEQRVTRFKPDNDGVRWRKEGIAYSLLLNEQYPRLRKRKAETTDAILKLEAGRNVVLFSVREYSSASMRVWATTRVNLARVEDTITVTRIHYGHFLRYSDDSVDMALLAGSGYDLYISCARRVTLLVPMPSVPAFVQVNGRRVRTTCIDGRAKIVIRPCGPRAKNKGRRAVPEGGRFAGRDPLPMAAVLEELDTILREHRTDYLPLVRQYLDHEEVNVRLAAAEVLGYLGGSRDAKAVARRLAVEVRLTSSLNGLGEPWHGKWEYFPSVTAMADALRKLGERSVQKVLHEALEQQYEPHAIGSITSALDALSEDGEVC